MPKEVKSAEEATEIAELFLKKYRWLVRPLKAMRGDDVWTVEVDVGLIGVAVATVKIDAKTGAVQEYNIPSSS
ncbi:MAG: PepSY domain-containing protein [Chloroflexota bacterium]